LISAYDFHDATLAIRRHLLRRLHAAAKRGASILLDSGNYESWWLRDSSWSESKFLSVLKQTAPPLAFTHDPQDTTSDPARSIAVVRRRVLRAQQAAKGLDHVSIAPIVHGDPTGLPDQCASLATEFQPLLLAVPERRLGSGIEARLRTARAVRLALDDAAPSCVLHLLGTGNPLSILAFALVGVESFDGLEWRQTCVDPATGHLHHFQHRALVDIPRHEPLIRSLPYEVGTMLHNLAFYERWLAQIRDAMLEARGAELLMRFLPGHRGERLLAAIGH
jgi:hypothetical protein